MTSPHAPTPNRQARLIAVVTAILLVTGCSYYGRLTKPARSADQPCSERCELLKTQCRQRQEYRERECAERYAAAKKDYGQCRGGAGHCLRPETCLGADMSICEREREGCVAACGGPVEKGATPAPGTETSKVNN